MKPDVIVSMVWVIVGTAICVVSAFLRLGSWRRPGPGLYPFLIGCAISLLSAVPLAVRLLRKTGGATTPEISSAPGGAKRILVLSSLLVVFTLALKPLGFLTSTFVFFVVLSKTVGNDNWTRSVLKGLVVSVLAHVVFRVWLRINLPPGIIGDYLGV